MAPTVRQIAEAVGVSRSTVSLVLQDSNRISKGTKARVRKAMQEMGYVYDRRAAQMRGRRSHGLGLVLTDVHNPGLAELAMALEDSSAQAGQSVVMAFTRDQLEKQQRAINTMLEYRLDGVVISPARGTTIDDLRPIVRHGTPIVFVTRRIKGFPSDYVGPNNMMAGRLLAGHLAEIGAQSLAFLGGSNGVSARLERARGLRDQWRRSGRIWRDDLSIVSNAMEDGGYDAVSELADRGELPDAIVGYSDTVVRGIIGRLRELGVQPGRRVAVAGFDNDPTTVHLNPSLTSVDTHMEQVAVGALELLIARIEDPGRMAVTRLIDSGLHVRDSTRLWRGSRNGR